MNNYTIHKLQSSPKNDVRTQRTNHKMLWMDALCRSYESCRNRYTRYVLQYYQGCQIFRDTVYKKRGKTHQIDKWP
jgi:hypothetical protein